METTLAGERPPPPPSDAEIVDRVRAGERDAFEVLMRRHNARVYRVIRSILRDESEVEDAMQEAYVRAYTRLSTFAGEATFSTWLTRIAANEALGRLRARGRRQAMERRLTAGAAAEDPEERAAARERLRQVERAHARLPPAYRSAFVLRELERLSGAEAASALGTTEEAIRLRLHRARKVLRRALGDERAAQDAYAFAAPRCDRVVAAVMARLRAR